MSAALDQGARSALERFVQRARRLLEEDLGREAEGRFGIHVADGEVEDEEGLHLDPSGLGARRDVVEILDFLRREEPTGAEAVGRLIREAAFTHLNRLVAIRIAEAIQLLPESLAKGSASTGFKELLEVAPLLAHDASGGYWRYLQLCGDELAADLPQLFDPRNPLLELAPSPAAFDDLIEMVGATDLDHVWDAPDALGWAYQFFNSGDERRAMRDASASPRNSRELAVRNQFFTPRYVVDFLVHNSLGRRLLEADPTSGLEDHLPMLLDPPTELGEPLALSDVRVLDPACGSGHFLLGAYDVLERAWELQGVSPQDAAPHIVSSLWGIDIDARCAQVAAAAVILRARRFCKTHDLPVPNIITARALPEPAEGWDALLASLPPDRRQLVTSIKNALDRAPVLGPLLKVEELLATEIRSHVVGADEDPSTLFGAVGIANDAFGRAETDVLSVLRQIADQTTSTPAERLLAAEANDVIRFVEALRHRYDAVLMNPPFGEPVAATKEYIKAAYPWIPTKDHNLFAAFVGRGAQLCNEAGSVGAITSRVGLFLKTFESWRKTLLVSGGLEVLADLGYGIMEQALVEAAAYVVAPGRRQLDGTFIRLLKESDKQDALQAVVSRLRSGLEDIRATRVPAKDFAVIPGSPICYWLAPELRALFSSHDSIGDHETVRVGIQTGDDFRFLRLGWEVLPHHISHGDSPNGRWCPHAKGGEYSMYWDDLHLMVDWSPASIGAMFGPSDPAAASSQQFRTGITWPRRTASAFGPRVLQAGAVIGNKGPAIFAGEERALGLLALLSTRLMRLLISTMLAAGDEVTSGGAAKSYEIGIVRKLPRIGDLIDDGDVVSLMRKVVELIREKNSLEETSSEYCFPRHLSAESLEEAAAFTLIELEDRTLAVLESTGRLDEISLRRAKVSEAGRASLDEEVGMHPASYPVREIQPDAFAELYLKSTDALIDTLVEMTGGSSALVSSSFHADRHLEVLAHGLRTNVKRLVEVRRESRLLRRGILEQVASDRLSYAFGVAAGRWDVRMALDPSIVRPVGALFASRPACPPGMLVGEDELPIADPPGGYPLEIPMTGVLLDEPGHNQDVVLAIERVAALLFDDSEQMMAEVVNAFGSKNLRTHLRSKFFKEHLARYSKSRRKAPIYWALYVPSGKWGMWLYVPRLTRETLYVVASEALRREGHAEVEIERLERERAAGGGGRGAKALDKALDDERKLGEELRRFRQEAERIAGLGWEPDLDDGIVLCAAPLADLFPMWKEPALYRKELRDGKYEWSTVSKWADQL